jgi:hypothetical protein
MKILFVFNEQENTNKYISTLKNALLAEGVDVICSADEFWNDCNHYDIIHFQLFESTLLRFSLNKIIERWEFLRLQCKIIVTCHDLDLYYIKSETIKKYWEYTQNHCDAMIHLGKYSYEYFVNKSNNKTKHYIISHHIYDNFYHFSMDKSLARKQLNIPLKANVLLCFGSFRNDMERNMILKAWKKADIPNKYLLTPGFLTVRRNFILGYKQVLKALYYKIKGIHFKNKFISHDMVVTYLCAADILMIQRCIILNSGNLSLGFHAKKVVVGPDVGNVGPILKERNNPVFDPNNITTVTSAIEEGFRLKDTDLPQENYKYAVKNWNVSEVARKHIEVYLDILQGN